MAKQNKDWKALNIKLDRTVYERLKSIVRRQA